MKTISTVIKAWIHNKSVQPNPAHTNTTKVATACRLGFLVCLSGLTACASLKTVAPEHMPLAQLEQVQESKYYSVKIPMHDGVELAATIYQPKLERGQTAPLILHSHGFAMKRMKTPMSFYGMWMFGGQSALAAWKQGYWVISYDQRGHGDSEGIINLISPEHEVRDVSSIIDWATEHLPKLAYEQHEQLIQTKAPSIPPIFDQSYPRLISTANDFHQNALIHTHHNETQKPKRVKVRHPVGERDPLIGMIGESYTGSAQLMAATVDKRIDALVPMTTWYDLNDSLLPGEVPKSGWLTTLIFSGNALNPGSMNPKLNYAYRKVRHGEITDDFRQQLQERSFRSFCQSAAQPGADALIMQGFRDSLFTFNHGLAIQQCLQAAGHDVRLIGTRTGHLLPLAQTSGLKTVYSLDRDVVCDEQQLSTQQMVLDWFDEKLKGQHNQATYIPKLCVTLDGNKGVNMERFPVGGQSFWVDPVELKSGMAGFWELALKPADWLMALVLPRKDNFLAHDFKPKHGAVRPAFVPLTAGSQDSYIAGIPTIDLTIEPLKDKNPDPTLFIGLGIKRSDSGKIHLVNDQITPLMGAGRHQQSLTAISTTLKAGEMLGLVVYTYSNQYRFSGSGFNTQATISGQINIPLHTATPLLLTELVQLEEDDASTQ